MIKIQRLSSSTFQFTSPKGKIIMIDPWLVGDPCWPIEEKEPSKLAKINTVLITHAHFDHFSGVGEIAKVNQRALFICQMELAMNLMARGLKMFYL